MASHSFSPGMGYKASCSYLDSNQADALHFEAGQLIEGLHISEDGNWIYGEIGNKRGWFPSEKAARMDLVQTPNLPPRNRRFLNEGDVYMVPTGTPRPKLNLPTESVHEPRPLVRSGSTLSRISNISDISVDSSIAMPRTATDYADALDGALKQLQTQGNFDNSESSYVEITSSQQRLVDPSPVYDEYNYMVMKSTESRDDRHSRNEKSYNKLINFVTFPRAERGYKANTLRDIDDYSYCDHFWSDKDTSKTGFDVLLDKQQRGRDLFQQMSKIIRERASAEDAYAKSLLRISKSNLGMDEPGTLGAVWRDIVRSIEDEAEVHRLWAISLVEKGRKELMAYVQKVRDGTRKATERVTKKRKLLQGKYNAIERAMKKVADKEDKLGSSRTNAGKHRARTELDQCEEELKLTIKSYNEAQRAWMAEMVTSSLELERFEEQRVELMKTSFGIYIHDRIQVAEQLDKNTVWLEERIQTIDPRLDRKEFVEACGTGSLRPTNFVLDI